MRKDIIQNNTAAGVRNYILLLCECKTIHLVRCLAILFVLEKSIRSSSIVISYIRAVCISLNKNAKLIIKESITNACPEFIIIGRMVLRIIIALRKHIKMQIAGCFS